MAFRSAGPPSSARARWCRPRKVAAFIVRAQKASQNNLERVAKLDASLEQVTARRTTRAATHHPPTRRRPGHHSHRGKKLTAAQLISFALRRYLPSMPVSPHLRHAGLPGAQRAEGASPTEEHIVFFENPRDPEVNAAVANACLRLNERKLQREGDACATRSRENSSRP